MPDILLKLLDSLCSNYENKEWGKFILKFLAYIIILTCAGLFLILVFFKVFEHIDLIVTVIGAVSVFIIILSSLIPKNRKEIKHLDEPILEYDPITLETTYKLIRKNLCSIIGDISDVAKLRKPVTLSQMDCPTHFDVISKAIIYHYLVLKTSDDFDAFTLSGIIQNALEQRLNNNEIEGITQTSFFYNGQVFPSLMVDSVKDRGNYIQIDLAIASEYYCRYRERRIYNNMGSSNNFSLRDRDF